MPRRWSAAFTSGDVHNGYSCHRYALLFPTATSSTDHASTCELGEPKSGVTTSLSEVPAVCLAPLRELRVPKRARSGLAGTCPLSPADGHRPDGGTLGYPLTGARDSQNHGRNVRLVNEPEDSRRRLLRQLIELSAPLSDTRSGLAAYNWDSDPLVELTVSDMVNVLERYLGGGLSPEQLGAWADAIEGRDDIGLEAGAEHQLKRLLFEISTPEINYKITRSQATLWRRQLLR